MRLLITDLRMHFKLRKYKILFFAIIIQVFIMGFFFYFNNTGEMLRIISNVNSDMEYNDGTFFQILYYSNNLSFFVLIAFSFMYTMDIFNKDNKSNITYYKYNGIIPAFKYSMTKIINICIICSLFFILEMIIEYSPVFLFEQGFNMFLDLYSISFIDFIINYAFLKGTQILILISAICLGSLISILIKKIFFVKIIMIIYLVFGNQITDNNPIYILNWINKNILYGRAFQLDMILSDKKTLLINSTSNIAFFLLQITVLSFIIYIVEDKRYKINVKN